MARKKRMRSSNSSDRRTSPSWFQTAVLKTLSFVDHASKANTWRVGGIVFVACFAPLAYLPSHQANTHEYNRLIDQENILREENKLIHDIEVRGLDLTKRWTNIWKTQSSFIDILETRPIDKSKAIQLFPALNQSFADYRELDKDLVSFEEEIAGYRFFSVYADDYRTILDHLLEESRDMRTLSDFNQRMSKAVNSVDGNEIVSFMNYAQTFVKDRTSVVTRQLAKQRSTERRSSMMIGEVETRIADMDTREFLIRGYSILILVCLTYISAFIILCIIQIARSNPKS